MTPLENSAKQSQAEIEETAAYWSVLLTSDDLSERESAHRAFEAWKKKDPRHTEAAQKIQSFISRVTGVKNNPSPARATVEATLATTRKSRARRSTVVVAMFMALTLPVLIFSIDPPRGLLADMRTATGKWETYTLADNTKVTLNSRTSVNVRFSAEQRTLELIEGGIFVDVARDPGRPFVVETKDGSIRALGTRFIVDRDGDTTRLNMLESKVIVTSGEMKDPSSGKMVAAGQSVKIQGGQLEALPDIDAEGYARAWERRQLVVNDQPLSFVLAQIGRHRPGYLYFDKKDFDAIRVSAVIPLDDTTSSLQLLQNNYPSMRVRTVTPYLVYVDMQPAN